MQVPWDRFHRAYEEYIHWQAFTLWARAVVESERRAPSWLKAILRERCPGFAEEAARSSKPELLGLQLLPWIYNQVFGFAKQKGWMRSCSMDSEILHPKVTWRIGNIAKASGGNDGQRHFPLLCGGGDLP